MIEFQATAEQLRMAQMMSDKQSVDDPDLQQKVMQVSIQDSAR
jgi:hypothetical protein